MRFGRWNVGSEILGKSLADRPLKEMKVLTANCFEPDTARACDCPCQP